MEHQLLNTSPATTTPMYVLNINNLVVASFSALLVLLLLGFFIGVMYICAKLRRRGPASAGATADVGDPGWQHSSFRSGAGASASATAALYGQNTAMSWCASDSLRRKDEQLALSTKLAMDRPAFYGRADARGGASAGVGVSSPASPGGGLVRAGLPQIAERQPQQQPRCLSYDEPQPHDHLRMQRLALSGPFVNEQAGGSGESLDRLGAAGLGGGVEGGDHYQSEEYLDIFVKK